LSLTPPRLEELGFLLEIETSSYPEDEAVTEASLTYRINNASSCFLVARLGDQIIGFTCGTLSNKEVLSHSTMFVHEAHGVTLNIHSVVISKQHRRKGYATKMLRGYLNIVLKNEPQISLVLLLCKSDLIQFYQNCGFKLNGASNVVHGKEQWFEMQR